MSISQLLDLIIRKLISRYYEIRRRNLPGILRKNEREKKVRKETIIEVITSNSSINPLVEIFPATLLPIDWYLSRKVDHFLSNSFLFDWVIKKIIKRWKGRGIKSRRNKMSKDEKIEKKISKRNVMSAKKTRANGRKFVLSESEKMMREDLLEWQRDSFFLSLSISLYSFSLYLFLSFRFRKKVVEKTEKHIGKRKFHFEK